MSIRLKLNGFEDLLEQIEKAGGTIDGAAKQCLQKSANIMHDELKKQMQAAIIDIKRKFGKNAILKGMNLEEGATAKDRNSQIGGHQA